MEKGGVTPDVITINNLMRAWMKDGMVDAALKLMQDHMRGPGARIEMDDKSYDAACIAARLVGDDILYGELRAEMR